MLFTVTQKDTETTSAGSLYTLRMSSRDPSYQYTILAVCKDDFDRINVGDHIEMLLTVIAPEPVAA